MAIEFRCTGCSKLLRTPDESAGKNAKCPHCGAIVPVPASGGAAAASGWNPTAGGLAPAGKDLSPFGKAATVGGGPFADPTQVSGGFVPPDNDRENPYASPMAMSLPAAGPGAAEPLPELRHCKIDFESVFRTTWRIFLARIGPFALVGLIAFGASIGLNMFSQFGGMIAQAAGDVLGFFAFQVIVIVASFLLQTWLNLALNQVCMKVIKSGDAKVNEMFAIGHCLLRGLLLSLVLGLVFFGISLVIVGPYLVFLFAVIGTENLDDQVPLAVATGIFDLLILFVSIQIVYMRLFLVFQFVVDRRAGVIESLQLSSEFMRGNKVPAFLVFLVVSLLGVLFYCLTCSFGGILFLPYMALLPCVVYIQATGQPISSALDVQPAARPPVPPTQSPLTQL